MKKQEIVLNNDKYPNQKSQRRLFQEKFVGLSESSKIGLIIFVVLFLSYAFFMQNYDNANIVSRMALTMSILQERTVSINNFHEATIDKAFYEGDYYSDKAPGLSFFSLPVSAVVYNLMRLTEPNPIFIKDGWVTSRFGHLVYFNTLITSGLLTAITALLIYYVSQLVGSSISGAVFAMVSFGLATQAWGWATALFGHALASACLFLGFAAILYIPRYRDDVRKIGILSVAAGALLAWAIVVEYSAAIASVIIGLYGLYTIRNWGRSTMYYIITRASAGFILLIIPLLIYQYIAFGSIFSVGYNYVPPLHVGMKEGFLGLTKPDLEVFFKITLSPYRGLFWFSPILLLSPIGIYYLWRDHNTRPIAIMIVIIAAYYLLFNSSYFYWDGGFSTGPRHLTPIIPFLCLPLSKVWTNARRGYKPILVFIFSTSFLIALMSAAINMFSPWDYENPLFDILLPDFLNDGGRNLFLILLRRISPPGPNEILDSRVIFRLSMVPMVLIWIVGYIGVANRINK